MNGYFPPPRREEALLSVEGLRLAFGEFEPVGGLSFAIERGQTLAIVGESGAG